VSIVYKELNNFGCTYKFCLVGFSGKKYPDECDGDSYDEYVLPKPLVSFDAWFGNF